MLVGMGGGSGGCREVMRRRAGLNDGSSAHDSIKLEVSLWGMEGKGGGVGSGCGGFRQAVSGGGRLRWI